MSKFDDNDPRVPQGQYIKVGVFPFDDRHTRFNAYTRYFEVIERLRDEWDKSDDPAYITVIKMRAANQIIEDLQSLQGKAGVSEQGDCPKCGGSSCAHIWEFED